MLLFAIVITLASCKKEPTRHTNNALHHVKDSVVYTVQSSAWDSVGGSPKGQETKYLLNGIILSDLNTISGFQQPALVTRITNFRPAVLDSSVIFTPLYTGDTITVITNTYGYVNDIISDTTALLVHTTSFSNDTLMYIIQ